MRRTILPSQEIQRTIDEVLALGPQESLAEMLGEIAVLGSTQLIQRVVEMEVQEHLGRLRYERSEGQPEGYRNGYRKKRVQTGDGELTIQVPQLRECAHPFVSTVIPKGKRILRTRPLEALVIGAFVRGLSMRDVESLTWEATGGTISKSAASMICKELSERYAAFTQSSLADVDLVVMFLDAIWLPVRPSGEKECVLVAWGINRDGERKLLSLMLGSRESEDAWKSLGHDLIRRGLPTPQLIVSDGAPGLIKAIDETWPDADRQRCTVHRLRNVLAKLPKREHITVKKAYWHALNEASTPQEGLELLTKLTNQLTRAGYITAAQCLTTDMNALVVHLKYPLRLRNRWRSTNLLERSLGEVKRRTKVIGRFPGETSCLSLCWAVLDLFISNQNQVRFTDIEHQHIQRLKNKQEPVDTNNSQATA